MSVWYFIQPEGTTNKVLNPSAETTGNYVAGGVGAVNRITTLSWKGRYAYEIVPAAGQGEIFLTLDTLANEIHYVSCVVTNATTWSASLDAGVTYNEMAVLFSLGTPGWYWIGVQIPAAQANGSVQLRLRGTGISTTVMDGIQVEEKSYATTYCDGDQEGCEWAAAEHASTSTRSHVSRAGGVVTDFADHGFDVEGMIGSGMSPITLNVDSYAILPGGELNSQKTNVRPFSLTGWIKGTSLSDLHTQRNYLIEDVAPNSVPENQPIRLWYTGATIVKEIEAFYETGLEGRIRGDFECLEQAFALRFLATDPNFTSIGETSSTLDSNDTSANRRNVSARLRSTGQWDLLGPPNAAGTYTRIDATLVGSDQTIYWGGDFLNFNNIGITADYLVQYTPSTATWAAVGGGLGAGRNIVRDIKEAPNGDIYICGEFLAAGGVGAANYVAYWDGAAWNAVGAPLGAATAVVTVDEMAFDSQGNLYVVGDFTDWASGAPSNLDHVVMWDGAAWNAVGNPTAGAAVITAVYTVTIDSQDNVYVGGVFTTFANVAGADYIAKWDGSAWVLVVQLGNTVYNLLADKQDDIYLTGDFQNAGGDANADRIAKWNGQTMLPLSTGLNSTGRNLAIGPDGFLYVVGVFTDAGGLTVPGAAKWNGASWAHLDMSYVTGLLTTVAIGPVDPVVPTNYDLWIGFQNTGTLNYAGIATVTNAGTEEAYPVIEVTRSGGTSATLYSIRNETTGKELLFAYSLLDGETLTIDLRPTQKSISSSFFGPQPDAILPNCDFGLWSLSPAYYGQNAVSCFVDIAGAPTILATLKWRDQFWSFD